MYGLLTSFRNKLYDFGIFKSHEIPVKSIVIGNLSAGGTGKTPFVLLIANNYSNKKIGVISRGYGRNTRGYIEVNLNHKATEVGDEPLLFRKELNANCIVAVCENRNVGASNLLKQYNDIQLILFDDAYQHRRIKAGLSIVLSEFNKPFFKDFMLPMGYLREWKNGLKRADLLIFSKCPTNLTEKQKEHYRIKGNNYLSEVYFSSIAYHSLVPINKRVDRIKNILLVSGIANPKPLIEKLRENYNLELMIFPDHHVFNESELTEIHQKFDNFASEDKIILTTEKDAVRLNTYFQTHEGKSYPWYTIPITIDILEEKYFFKKLDSYVGKI